MKIGFVSLGCPKNLVDGEVMLGMARDAGHEITSDAALADVLVVNTCAFIDTAKEESVDAILEMAELKRQHPGKRLVVTGCLAERYRDQLKTEIPEIDAVLGTGEVPGIVDAVEGRALKAVPMSLFRSSKELAGGAAEASDEPAGPTYLYDASTPRLQTTPRHYAYIKIAEGCDRPCAFCIIPKLRGPQRSRDPESVVREGEYATVAKYAQSWKDNFGFDAMRILSSNTPILTPEARKNLKTTITSRYQASRGSYDTLQRSYTSQINTATGLADGGDRLTDYAGLFPGGSPSGGAPGGGGPNPAAAAEAASAAAALKGRAANKVYELRDPATGAVSQWKLMPNGSVLKVN